MAVVQISRIQIRRGKKKETGIPQLASGEMAWAIDSQELWIGTGSVAEGAPYVDNIKVLTENDLNGQGTNVLDLIRHIYKINDPTIQTGEFASVPVARTLQDRFDDRVTLADFVDSTNWLVTGYDYTQDLQRAINQLFLNLAGRASVDTTARVTLEIPAGVFTITGTIYVPSYATIVGAGKEKTIIEHTGTSPAFRFVNDLSTPTAPAAITTTTFTNQPRFVTLSNLTVYTKTTNQTALQLDCVRDSKFENVAIQGDYDPTETSFSPNSKGIELNAFAAISTCERNVFKNVEIVGFQTAVYAAQDIARNTFDGLYVNKVFDGIILGAEFFGSTNQLQEVDGTTDGKQYGPRYTIITNSIFGDLEVGVYRHAVFIGKGIGNTVSETRLIKVGNEGGNPASPVFPQIYITSVGNSLKNISSDRTKLLSNPASIYAYVPEVAGTVDFESHGTGYAILSGASTTPLPAFRLPLSATQNGNPRGRSSYVINYFFKADTGDNFVRQGKIYVTADADNAVVQLADEYNFAGTNNSHELILDFKAAFLDSSNVEYTDPSTQTVASLAINYSNVPVSGLLFYSYSSSTYDSGIIPTI